MKQPGRFFLMTFLSIALLLPLIAACHAAEAIIPVPPDFIKDKELPGEDPYWVYRPAFSPDQRYAAGFLHSSAKIVIWDLKEGKIIKEFEESIHGMPALDGYEFSLDGKKLLLMYRDLPLKYLDLEQGKVVKEIPINADPKKLQDYAFSPNMKLLALATNNGIKLWDLEKEKEIKVFLKGKVISSVDMVFYTTPKGKTVRLLAYGMFLQKGESFDEVAGIINMDSGSVTPVLKDAPKDKIKQGNMTFFWVSFEHGGGYLAVAYSVLPPVVNAGVYLVDCRTGKYLANHTLEQLILTWDMYYLWKPYYGYLINTKNMAVDPYKGSLEFLIITREAGLKVIDRTREDVLPVQSITVSRDQKWALIALKKSQADPSRVFLYKIVPKGK